MKKKYTMPFPLRVIRWLYPKAEKVAPRLAHAWFVNIFFTPLPYPVPEKERKAETFARLFTFEAAGHELQGYAWGEHAPYVLVIHGWAGRATQFRRFVKPLMAAGYSVVGFDAPAHGRSGGKKTSIKEFLPALQNLYALRGEPAAILTHSLGGAAALYSAMSGLPIRRLINIASPTLGDEIVKAFLQATNASPASGEYFLQYVLATYGRPFHEFTAMHAIQNLPHPIDLLLVYDADDREVTLKHAQALVEVYPAARLMQTQGLGHTRILKDNAVIAACVTFIKEGRLPGEATKTKKSF